MRVYTTRGLGDMDPLTVCVETWSWLVMFRLARPHRLTYRRVWHMRKWSVGPLEWVHL